MGEWITEGTPPPPSVWLAPTDGQARYGDASIKRDSVGNALGGIRLPDVKVGRGRFYGVSPDSPPAGAKLTSMLARISISMTAFGITAHTCGHLWPQANSLLAARLLLQDDHEALITSAAESRVGLR